MTPALRIFVSSVQKELEDERLIVQNLVNTDSFLSAHCVPVLYEFEPASPDKVLGCLKSLDRCQVYLLIVGVQYGTRVGELSITHSEYRRAKDKHLPVLAFIKGDRSVKREEGTDTFLKELDADGFKHKRFGNVIELQKGKSALRWSGSRAWGGLCLEGDGAECPNHPIIVRGSVGIIRSPRLPTARWNHPTFIRSPWRNIRRETRP